MLSEKAKIEEIIFKAKNEISKWKVEENRNSNELKLIFEKQKNKLQEMNSKVS